MSEQKKYIRNFTQEAREKQKEHLSQIRQKEMEKKYDLDYDNICVLFFRGNDKATEIKLGADSVGSGKKPHSTASFELFDVENMSLLNPTINIRGLFCGTP